MPYETKLGTWERARRLGHVPIVDNEFVKSRLRSYRLYNNGVDKRAADDLLVPAEDLADPGPGAKWAFAFDGSSQEVAVREEYPSTRVGYIQVAGVLVHLEEILKGSHRLFVDPAVVRSAARESLLSIVLPGSNVCREGMSTVRDSWRMEVFELFRDYNVEGRPILDLYFRLLRLGGKAFTSQGEVILARCPAGGGCDEAEIAVPKGGTTCPRCGGAVFPTDSIRVHEEVQELSANMTAIGRLMSVLEHIVMLCYLDYLLEHKPHMLSSVAFIIDGPLALFGPPAPLKRAILAYLQSMARELKRRNYEPPLVIGIEKGGQFVEHAAQIADRIPERTLMRLPDSYIFKRILATRPNASYAFGQDTYYGRKFFYKSAMGQMLTITVPPLDEELPGRYQPDDPACYRTLPTALALLDGIGTRLYEDAIIPVALAHSFASIPLKTGSRVLTLLSREFLGQAASEAQK